MMDFAVEQYVKVMNALRSLKSEKGQGLVEYALLLVLIAVVVIAAVRIIGQKACSVYSYVGTELHS